MCILFQSCSLPIEKTVTYRGFSYRHFFFIFTFVFTLYWRHHWLLKILFFGILNGFFSCLSSGSSVLVIYFFLLFFQIHFLLIWVCQWLHILIYFPVHRCPLNLLRSMPSRSWVLLGIITGEDNQLGRASVPSSVRI